MRLFLRLCLLSGIANAACIELGTLRREPADDAITDGGGEAGQDSSSLGGRRIDEGAGGRLTMSGGRSGTGVKQTSGGRAAGEPDGGAAGASDRDSGGSPSQIADGGAIGTGGSDSGGNSSGQVPIVHTYVYAFNSGSWIETEFLDGDTIGRSSRSFDFGGPGDTPLLGYSGDGAFSIGTYRDGVFSFDTNRNRHQDAGDSARQFMPPGNVQTGDQPFVIRAQLWGRNQSGACAPRVQSSDLTTSVIGTMVGIQRGVTTFLDLDGDGVYQGKADHCDLSTTGEFAAPDDFAFGAPEHAGAKVTTFGTVRIVEGRLYWFFDNDLNLAWTPPRDTVSISFGLSEGAKVPATHPGGISIANGRLVYYDFDGDHVWTAADKTYVDVLPEGGWELVGVDRWLETR